MYQSIRKQFTQIQLDKRVLIFYACESGSRAWGFASEDSDFDVRFLYVHPKDWYLSINVENRRDVIEKQYDNLDLVGWDLRKALRLFYKSNPPLMEWLQSPIIYRDVTDIASEMRALIPDYYSPRSAMYHYYHMAEGNYRTYLKGSQVWLKKYFYVLRPLLAIQWIERNYGPVPVAFSVLVERLITDESLLPEIEELLNLKRQGDELRYGAKLPALGDFIKSEIERLEHRKFNIETSRPSMDKLNDLFRMVL